MRNFRSLTSCVLLAVIIIFMFFDIGVFNGLLCIITAVVAAATIKAAAARWSKK